MINTIGKKRAYLFDVNAKLPKKAKKKFRSLYETSQESSSNHPSRCTEFNEHAIINEHQGDELPSDERKSFVGNKDTRLLQDPSTSHCSHTLCVEHNFKQSMSCKANTVPGGQTEQILNSPTKNFCQNVDAPLIEELHDVEPLEEPPTQEDLNERQVLAVAHADNVNDFYQLRNELYDGGFMDEMIQEDLNYEEVFAINHKMKKLNQLHIEEGFFESIGAYVNLSKGELLLMAFKYSVANNQSFLALSNLLKFINRITGEQILPETRYKLDSLFNADDNVTLHSVCLSCSNYLGEFNTKRKEINCSSCNTKVLVSNPSEPCYFALIDPSDAIRDYLQQYENYYDHIMNIRIHERNHLKDVYDGKVYRNFVKKLPDNIRHTYVTATLNTDGAQAFKCSNFSIWPIYIMLNEIPAQARYNNLIVVGMWFGKKKPELSVILRQFVKEMNKLAEVGIPVKIKGNDLRIHLFIILAVVDTVARAPLNGTSQFNANYGCDWCEHPGTYYAGSMRYSYLNPPPPQRNKQTTISYAKKALIKSTPIIGVKSASPLLNLKGFDIIKSFTPDYMHCVLAGVTRQFLNCFLDMLSTHEIKELDDLILNIKAPNQIGRLSRKVTERQYWKCREMENWLLYYSLPLLDMFIEDKRFIKHWSLLVDSAHICLQTDITYDELNNASNMLHTFVSNVEELYSLKEMTYNVHQLLHLVNSTENWGPWWTHSAFAFESANHKLLCAIQCAKGVVLQIISRVSKRRDQFKVDVENFKNNVISKIDKVVPALVELNRRFSIVFVNSMNVDKAYDTFFEYLKNSEKYKSKIVAKFAMDSVAEDNCGLLHLLTEIDALLTLEETSSPSTIKLLNQHIQLFLRITNVSQSPQQFLYNFLISVLYTQIKAYITMKYSFEVLQLQQTGQYSGHIKRLEQDVAIRINKTISTFKIAMANVPREIWENNPVEHKEDITFAELKNVFQSYVINEADFKNDGSCGKTCKDFKLAKAAVDCYYDTEFCKKHQRCSGTLHDCVHQFDEVMHVCLEEKNSTRRYQYIDVEYQRYGLEDKKCPSKAIELDRHYSSHNMAFCDPCICLCDDDVHPKTERYFSLIPSIATVKENYVLTGARFVKHKRTIHIQIQQGQLLPYGHVNESTVKWLPIKVDVLTEDEVYKIKWPGPRTVFLDDIEVPRNNVVVGLGFKVRHQDEIYVLRLTTYSVPMNFSAGVLTNETYEGHSSEESGDEIDLKNLDIPTRRSSQTIQKSTNHQYLKFRTTGLLNDLGQSTIPFIDTQSVTTTPASPMSGAGIYHRRSPGDGGFLALKLFTFNVEPELQADIVENQIELK